MPESQLINVCFTLNNYTPEEEFLLLFLWKPMTYMVWGKEIGESGTPHLQGYFELTHKMRPSALHKLDGLKRAHFIQARGTAKQASTYCKKDGDYIILGEPKKREQGRRRDLEYVREAAMNHGLREVSCWANYQQFRVAQTYLEYNEPERDEVPTVTWIWGKAGTGKSRRAKLIAPNAYRKSNSSKWWRGYDGERNVILDDFRDSWMPFTDFLDLLDRYGCIVENKGGYRQFRGNNIVITCNRPPEEMYRNLPEEDKSQLLRRITSVIDMSHSGTEVGRVIVKPPDNLPTYTDAELDEVLQDLLGTT